MGVKDPGVITMSMVKDITAVKDNSDLSNVTSMFPPTVASPGGIPPWEPPDDSGEWLAYEGWAEWVEAHGALSHRMELLGYRIETAAKIFMDTLTPAIQTVSKAVTKFMAAMNKDDA